VEYGLLLLRLVVGLLFAGSSEAALREMFSRASAPFYNWAPVEPFPLLGDAFVSATVAQVRRLAKLVVWLRARHRGTGALVDALSTAGYTPYNSYLRIDRAGTALRHGDATPYKRLIAQAKLGYGPNGQPPIGPNSTLVFEVELMGIAN